MISQIGKKNYQHQHYMLPSILDYLFLVNVSLQSIVNETSANFKKVYNDSHQSLDEPTAAVAAAAADLTIIKYNKVFF